MNRKGMCVIISGILLILLCSCMGRGPFSPPLKQTTTDIIKVEFVDGRNEADLFNVDTYSNYVIYTLDTKQTNDFIEGLLTVEFYIPSLEPSRHLGDIAVRIYYKNGNSDLIGSNCNYSVDSNLKILDRGVYYPDEDAFYSLFAKFVDSQLLPRR